MQLISIDEAEEYVHDPVATVLISEHRWYNKQLIVFNGAGGLWGFYYMKPATEMQEGQDRFESDPVEIFPVKSHEVTITTYEEAA